VPRLDGADDVTVVCWRRDDDGRYHGLDHRLPRPDVPDLLRRIVDDPDAQHPGLVGPSPADVLLCAHGRRDRCCGRAGTLLEAEIRARWPNVRTWRCSHTGGHRFAPTGLTFPHGRAWAYLDGLVLDGILDRTLGWSALAAHHRGSLALDQWAQAVEGAALAERGWDLTDLPLRVRSTDVDDDRRWAVVTLEWGDRTAVVHARGEVRVTRDLPVVVCGLPLDAATKTTPELRVTSLVIS
jgi:hypothetical protein